jgi:hypothetical protein
MVREPNSRLKRKPFLDPGTIRRSRNGLLQYQNGSPDDTVTYQLYLAHYEVRAYIAACLKKRASGSSSVLV